MYCVRKVTDDIYWVGGNDHRLALFENIHPIPRGVSYNSYVLLDEKTVLFDTTDWAVCRQFIENIKGVLNGRSLDYLVVNHVEPDHAASLEEILIRWPEVKIISTPKAFQLMQQFGFDIGDRGITVKEGESMSFGKHTVSFYTAAMVHWPEVMVSFDETSGCLFSADAFGTFGALDGKLFNDEVDFDRDWLDDARRYYTNIVGKYGKPVQNLLKKASKLDIKMICPLHGPVWRSDLGYFIDKYDKWSKYEPEVNGVLICYASMYGNTESAAQALATMLVDKGVKDVAVYDVSTVDTATLISESFKYGTIVLASVTYNLNVFPIMHNYIEDMKALCLCNRKFAIIENGSWSPTSGGLMEAAVNEMKGTEIIAPKVTVCSSLCDDKVKEIEALADTIIESLNA